MRYGDTLSLRCNDDSRYDKCVICDRLDQLIIPPPPGDSSSLWAVQIWCDGPFCDAFHGFGLNSWWGLRRGMDLFFSGRGSDSALWGELHGKARESILALSNRLPDLGFLLWRSCLSSKAFLLRFPQSWYLKEFISKWSLAFFFLESGCTFRVWITDRFRRGSSFSSYVLPLL